MTEDSVGPHLWAKLVNMLGRDRAIVLVKEVLGELRVSRVHTADERFKFGERVMKRGGLYQVLGRSIQTQAILHGARLLTE